jgi:hypothetical protein
MIFSSFFTRSLQLMEQLVLQKFLELQLLQRLALLLLRLLQVLLLQRGRLRLELLRLQVHQLLLLS